MASAVLLVAFGGPACLEDVAPFMRSIMGAEPPAAALDAASRKYVAIGGCSPLPATAERIAAKLEHSLNGITRDAGSKPGARATHGVDVPVVVGMLHSAPTIDEAVAGLAAREVTALAWASLSPFEASVTTGAFQHAIAAAARRHGMSEVAALTYHASGPYVTFFTESATAALAALGAARPLLVFTAHSLPAADAPSDGTYVTQLRETCVAVASRIGPGAIGEEVLPGVGAFGGHAGDVPWLLCFQSRGARSGEWLGPDLVDVVRAAASAGHDGLAVVPVGFAIDHMETLYDIDQVAAQAAAEAGIRLARAHVPDDDPRMIDALARAVRPVL